MKQKALHPVSLVLAAILAVGVALRLIGLGRSIWFDEFATLEVVGSNPLLPALRLDDHPPLYYALLRAWGTVSQDVAYLRLLSVLLGVGTLILVVLWVRRTSPAAAVVSGLLVATLPIVLRYSQELRSYPLLLFGTALAFYAAAGIADQPRRRLPYLWLGVGLALAVLSQLIGVMVITTLALYLTVEGVDRRVLRWGWLAAAFAVPLLLFVGYYAFFTLHDYSNWWMPPLSVGLVAETLRNVLGVPSLFWPVAAAGQAVPFLARPWDVVIKTLIALVTGLVVIGGDWRKSWPLFAAAIFFWAQVVAYSLLVTPIFWYRTLLPGLIPLVAWFGVQVTTVRPPAWRTTALVVTVMLCLLYASHWALAKAWVSEEGFLEVARLVDAEWQPGDLLLYYPAYTAGPVRFYLRRAPAIEGVSVDVGDAPPRLNAPRAFLVVRDDVNAQRDPAYAALLDRLEARYGPPQSTRRYGLIYLQVYGPAP